MRVAISSSYVPSSRPMAAGCSSNTRSPPSCMTSDNPCSLSAHVYQNFPGGPTPTATDTPHGTWVILAGALPGSFLLSPFGSYLYFPHQDLQVGISRGCRSLPRTSLPCRVQLTLPTFLNRPDSFCAGAHSCHWSRSYPCPVSKRLSDQLRHGVAFHFIEARHIHSLQVILGGLM